MDGAEFDEVVGVFLTGAHAVARALADASVAVAWHRPSVLEDQDVSSLAGHLARGGVWVVGDYLDAGQPAGPADFNSAAEYFAAAVSGMTEEGQQAIRDRGAAVGAMGRPQLLDALGQRIAGLERRLPDLGLRHLVTVMSGRIMELGDYLVTRIVEQTVHLDDLARSVERDPWPLPAAEALTLAVGVEIGRLRSGSPTMLRTLYRRGFASAALPVL